MSMRLKGFDLMECWHNVSLESLEKVNMKVMLMNQVDKANQWNNTWQDDSGICGSSVHGLPLTDHILQQHSYI